MNYLGHLLVVPHRGLVTLGNLLGDFVKGRLDAVEPVEFRVGLRLHRELDQFADAHALVKQSKARVGEERRRVSGVLVDVFYDHFLAKEFDAEPHRESLLRWAAELPEELQELPGRMISSRWLGSYRTVDGIGAVLRRMDERRARPLGLSGAEQELLREYDRWEAEANAFFLEAQTYAGVRAAALLADVERDRVGLDPIGYHGDGDLS